MQIKAVEKGEWEYLKTKRLISVLLIIAMAFSITVVASASDNTSSMAKVVFKASEPDANGLFTATLTVYNATFNAFQFAFSYNKEAVLPADATGKAAAGFSDFGKPGDKTSSWMETLGNKLNTEKGLLECGGYVKPGSGSIKADASGILLYTFTFHKTGNGDAGIKLATADSGGPFNPSIKEGGGIAESGYNVDAIIEVKLPKALGESVTAEIVTPKSEPANNPGTIDAKTARMKNTVIMKIANGAAIKDGFLNRIDIDNKLVTPYIDTNSRTMVPIRFLAESLGATVDWDGNTQRITIMFNNKKIIMTVGSKEYSIDNAAKVMDTMPVINKGWSRTMVPIRFVAEALGMDVKWDPDNRLVIVSPLSSPWDLDGTVEKEVLTNILLLFSPLMRDFN